ncbi:MAG: hypothetical protein HY563_09120 [Ignavibacteriales bacterium]|nr:hypothetical protein [Ignavibacteriales bacterium]
MFSKAVRLCIVLTLVMLPVVGVLAQEADSLKEIRRQIDILVEELERLRLGEVAEPFYEPQRGLGPAAAKVYQLKKTGVSIAGYGEVVYENYAKKRDDGIVANKPDKIDYLRNVVYVGFRYNDWILFNSEIEFEHGSTGKGGEVSVEFGYVELMLSPSLNIRAGMILPPLGIINEKHEPSTFFGSLRPQVERSIIPSTWRTNGVGAYGDLGSLVNYRAYIVEGFHAKNFSDADGLRGGRQSGANARAENFGLTGRLEFTGIAGGIVGGSFYYGNSGQGQTDSLGTIKAATTLWSLHAEYAWKSLDLRAVIARVAVDEAGRASALAAKTIGSEMTGWYVVAGYDLVPLFSPGSQHSFSPFVQFESLNTHASVAPGFTANKAFDRNILTVGISYKPHPNVALKIDYQDIKNAAGTGINQWNAAVNYLY